MQCVVCKHGETQPGITTVTLERDNTTLVIKGVPAQVCNNCGEAYFDAHITGFLLESLNNAVRLGVQVEVRAYEMSKAS